ncbi:carbonyl reductase 1-like [Amia ocellicauda]|uniref:carbonyl reductase 1-like n=1 Tax=Amia ocellicauda TaxID=2972642 RepID=UPI003464C825|nr:CBR1 reductase [Amia calva]
MSTKKVAVVTGGNKGIGLSIVTGLCRAGYPGDVVLTARDEARGQAAVAALKAEGHTALFQQLDICDQASVERLRDFLAQKYGGLDVLVNNAGIAFKVDAVEPFGEQAAITMETNFWGTVRVSRALLPLIRPQGRVVNVSSFVSLRALKQCSPEKQQRFRDEQLSEEELGSLMKEFVSAAQQGDHQAQGWPNTAYGTSKIGVTVLSRIQACSLTQTRPGDGILLNACCPGWVRTDMAGPKAPRSPEEGAETPLYLALLPPNTAAPHGQFVSDKTVKEW